MTLKQRLQANVALSLAAAAVVCLALFHSLYRLDRASQAAKAADEILVCLLERVTLRNDYIRNGSARARDQWVGKQEQMRGLLAAAARYGDAGDRRNVEGLVEDDEASRKIFEGIVELREQRGSRPLSGEQAREVEERLIGQLNMRVYEEIAHGRSLLESANRARGSAFQLAAIVILGSVIALVAVATANSWAVGRALARRVGRLRDGASVIGAGNLDHRVAVEGTDEIAELSASFNAMTAGLAASRRDLEREGERLRLALESANAGTWEWDPQTGQHRWSAQVWELYGIAPQGGEPSIEAWLACVLPEDQSAGRDARQALLDGKEINAEWRVHAPGGGARWLLTRGRWVLNERGERARYVGIVVDVTDRKNHEEALRAIERERAVREHAAQLRAAQRLAKVGSWSWSIGSDAYTWSEELYRIVGRDAGSAPATQKEFASLLQPEDAALLAGALERAVETGQAAELQVELRRLDGNPCSAVVRVEALRDEHGRVVSLLGTVQDVTEQRRQEAQLRQSQKLEGIGRLAGGVAHDFNNLLTAILGFGSELLDGLREGDPLRDAAREVNLAAQRAAGLTRQLLVFSRKQVVEARVLNLNEIVVGMERMLARLLGEDVELVARPAPGIGSVKADPGLVEQVIMNLAVNARDAMPRGGRLTIETADVELTAEQLHAHPGVAPGPYVMLAVSDSGAGMSAEVQAHLFEPFFTTKEPGKGTGLGLSTVYGIVKQAGGHVWVYSEVGKGSVFKVFLPRTEEAADPREIRVARALPEQQTGELLVVEDDAQVRALNARILRRLGYTVTEASGGDEALRVLASRSVDAVITDLVMPRMSGEELTARIRADHPDVRVLLVSGYTEHSGALQRAVEGGAAFLQKPFTPTVLADKVRELLAGRRPSPSGVSPRSRGR